MFKNLLIIFLLLNSLNLFATQKINGAGATFPYPIYSKWFSEYQKTHKNIEFNYQSIGSGGGVKQVLAQTVDFGATDAAMSDEELKTAKMPIYHIPTVIGAVTVAYNLKGVSTGIKIDGTTLANIFQGKITKWNDAALVKLNPSIKFPPLDILIVRRSDGSGTTSVFTNFLAAVSTEWKAKIGSGKNISWPVGIGAKGNEGVTAMIAQTDGAIGYVELAYSVNAKLATAAIKNKKGEFVVASVDSISKAAASIKVSNGDFRISIINADGKGAYPISSLTWILLPENPASAPTKALKEFLKWALVDGQAFTSELHYGSLPKHFAESIIKSIK